MNHHRIPTSDAIVSGFPHPVLPRIDEPPARVDIDMAQEMQTENAASRPYTRGGGIHSHAAMVVPPARYAAEYSNVAYIWEVNPGGRSDIPSERHSGKRTNVRKRLCKLISRIPRENPDAQGVEEPTIQTIPHGVLDRPDRTGNRYRNGFII